ncbi:MAG: hypothetical protein LC122_11800 [Chitinophagales bacterium]|nr:hypothetical protein [Chitinophagales bacterium]
MQKNISQEVIDTLKKVHNNTTGESRLFVFGDYIKDIFMYGESDKKTIHMSCMNDVNNAKKFFSFLTGRKSSEFPKDSMTFKYCGHTFKFHLEYGDTLLKSEELYFSGDILDFNLFRVHKTELQEKLNALKPNKTTKEKINEVLVKYNAYAINEYSFACATGSDFDSIDVYITKCDHDKMGSIKREILKIINDDKKAFNSANLNVGWFGQNPFNAKTVPYDTMLLAFDGKSHFAMDELENTENLTTLDYLIKNAKNKSCSIINSSNVSCDYARRFDRLQFSCNKKKLSEADFLALIKKHKVKLGGYGIVNFILNKPPLEDYNIHTDVHGENAIEFINELNEYDQKFISNVRKALFNTPSDSYSLDIGFLLFDGEKYSVDAKSTSDADDIVNKIKRKQFTYTGGTSTAQPIFEKEGFSNIKYLDRSIFEELVHKHNGRLNILYLADRTNADSTSRKYTNVYFENEIDRSNFQKNINLYRYSHDKNFNHHISSIIAKFSNLSIDEGTDIGTLIFDGKKYHSNCMDVDVSKAVTNLYNKKYCTRAISGKKTGVSSFYENNKFKEIKELTNDEFFNSIKEFNGYIAGVDAIKLYLGKQKDVLQSNILFENKTDLDNFSAYIKNNYGYENRLNTLVASSGDNYFYDISYFSFDGEKYFSKNEKYNVNDLIEKIKKGEYSSHKGSVTCSSDQYDSLGFRFVQNKIDLNKDDLFKILHKNNGFVSGLDLVEYIHSGSIDNFKFIFKNPEDYDAFMKDVNNKFTKESIKFFDEKLRPYSSYKNSICDISYLCFNGEEYFVDPSVNKTTDELIKKIKDKKYSCLVDNEHSPYYNRLGFTQTYDKFTEQQFFKFLRDNGAFISGATAILYILDKKIIHDTDKRNTEITIYVDDYSKIENVQKKLNEVGNPTINGLKISVELSPDWLSDIAHIQTDGINFSVKKNDNMSLTADELIEKIKSRKVSRVRDGVLNEIYKQNNFTEVVNITQEMLFKLMKQHNGYIKGETAIHYLLNNKLNKNANFITFNDKKDKDNFLKEIEKYYFTEFKITVQSKDEINSEEAKLKNIDVSELVFDGEKFTKENLYHNNFSYFDSVEECIERIKNRQFYCDEFYKMTGFMKFHGFTKVEKFKKKYSLAKLTEKLKDDAKNAAYSSAATQAINLTQKILVNATKSDEDNAIALSKLLDTEFGHSLLSLMLGTGLLYTDKINDERVAMLANKLRQNGMAKTGNLVFDELFASIAPELKKVVEDIPNSNIRVEVDQTHLDEDFADENEQNKLMYN